MSLVLSILKDSKIRIISAGTIGQLLADPKAIDPVNIRHGNYDRDKKDFNRKIAQRHKELSFTGEPGAVNKNNKRKIVDDPYKLP